MYYIPRQVNTKIELTRINRILYVRINDGNYERMQDYTTFTNYFNVPLTFGAALNNSGKPFRYFKGTFSDVEVKFMSDDVANEEMPVVVE